MCLEASNHGKVRSKIFETLRRFPNAYIREPLDTRKPWRLSRSLMCASRQRMRQCKFCLVPAGLTPTSRRFYEAIATHCIPVLISDKFVVPYAGGHRATGLLPDAALDSFVLRVPEADVKSLPRRLKEALPKYASMLQRLSAHRSAFLYELPLDGERPAAGAACALIADVAKRFGVHGKRLRLRA